MKKIALFLTTMVIAALSHAALNTGDSLTPYIIHNVSTGKEYCQVCAYGTKTAKIVAFGKLADASFWADLQKLQKIQDANPNLGVFAHVFDSGDADAIKAAAAQHNITFPVVMTSEKDWNDKYHVNGVSRTIYYAQQKNNITWTSTGLDGGKAADLAGHVKKDLSS